MSTYTILIVEDERLVAEDISECLQECGYHICGIANEGNRAIELARTHQPDLILMDIVIQGEIDGIETAERIREELDISCIFLTAYSQDGILNRAKKVDPLGFIVKPFEESSLISTVEIAIHKSAIDAQVKDSAEWFSTTLDSIHDGVIATNAYGEIRFVNRLASELTGVQLVHAEGLPINDVFVCQNSISGELNRNPAIDSLTSGRVEKLGENSVLVPKTGPKVAIEATGSPIHDSSDETIGAVLIFRDVSERRAIQEKMTTHQRELELLVEERTAALRSRIELERLTNEIASDFLVSNQKNIQTQLDRSLKRICEFLNLAGGGIHQADPDLEGAFQPLSVHLKNEDDHPRHIGSHPKVAAFPWIYEQLLKEGQAIINDIEDLPATAVEERSYLNQFDRKAFLILSMTEDHSRIATFAAHERRTWTEDEIVGLTSVGNVFENAINRNKMESDQNNLQEQLIQSQKLEAIGKLTGGIAHDFNNMLVPIMGYADSILESTKSNPWHQEVTEIRKAAESAASLTRQLLAFSKKQILDKAYIKMHEEVAGMEGILSRLLGEDILLKVENCASSDLIEADKGQLQQILMNLCVNSADAMPTGGTLLLKTSCALDSETGDQNVILTISDTGEGMNKEALERAIDPFFTTKGMDGTGLGLSVVIGIVEQHNGTMDITSEEGKGTTVRIAFPLAHQGRSSREPTLTVPPPISPDNRKFEVDNKLVMLVEDEPAVMIFVSRALQKCGFEVLPARDLSEALSVFDQNHARLDFVLTDAKLPDGTGIEVINHVHKLVPAMKVLLSSGYTDDRALVDEAKEHGVKFLQKPYSLSQLHDTIREVIESDLPSQKDSLVELSS